jgi:hypothetical protein
VDRGLSPLTKTVGFAAQAADRQILKLFVFIGARSEGRDYTYVAERQVGGAWSRFRLTPLEFRPLAGQGTVPKLAPENVRAFGFMLPPGSWARGFFIDDLETEFK